MSVILGTAGHIDHGKTTIIRALTGIDCDRLDEEKKRGITIDLGFAWLDLPCGERIGIIDVPGHEKFVRNMVAGATGIDLVMLVIAADEGIMPQTREHLEICTLLGVRAGFVVITKIDLVDPDWLELLQEEIKQALQNTFLANCQILQVSAKTGAGLHELKDFLNTTIKQLPPKITTDLFRLPIDRVFTMRGHGTVVTGTVLAGELKVGENVWIMPDATPSKARSIERHETNVDKITFGTRCAINLQGLDVQDVERGQIVAKEGELFAAQRWYIKLSMLPTAAFELKNRTEVHFHHGTKECQAKIILRGCQNIKAGESTLAEVHFTKPMCGVFFDYAVLRNGSPLQTFAGCQIIGPIAAMQLPLRHQPLELYNQYLDLLQLYQHCQTTQVQDKATFVQSILDLAPLGLNFKQLKVCTNLSTRNLESGLNLLTSQGKIILFDKEAKSYISKLHFDQLLAKLLVRAQELHNNAPLQKTFAAQALFGQGGLNVEDKLRHKLLEYSLKNNQIIAEGEGLRLASHSVKLATEQDDLGQQILARHKSAGFMPPNFKDVVDQLGIAQKDANTILKVLVNNGQLVRVKDGLYYDQTVMQEIIERVKLWFTTHDNLDIAALKSILGISRKYLIAILEYMDNCHITMRVGDQRKLRKTSN